MHVHMCGLKHTILAMMPAVIRFITVHTVNSNNMVSQYIDTPLISASLCHYQLNGKLYM